LSESRMREICLSGSMSGERKRSVAEWPKLPRLSSTLPFATDQFNAGSGHCPLCAVSDQNGAASRTQRCANRRHSADSIGLTIKEQMYSQSPCTRLPNKRPKRARILRAVLGTGVGRGRRLFDQDFRRQGFCEACSDRERTATTRGGRVF
jgi:hypothetical protein